eukprot:NODE_6314_length_459_cov_179.043902_g4793_i0.p2 GENE.NODE_6314_length_459_cov_179.043902_g4793_i0~~NODE_6314_length_459_cov_179.043902_g4793_i0.p2  ORF type:complete len:104 (+),score=46.09 NODE_6314_length_459_cov_179.043902_g4793_i0:31-342(+)
MGGNPLVPLMNDVRAMAMWTSIETMQRQGPQTNSLKHSVFKWTPLRWFHMMKMHPGKVGPALVVWWALLGGWGVEFIKNIGVMGQEKPPIDWNNEKLGALSRK